MNLNSQGDPLDPNTALIVQFRFEPFLALPALVLVHL